jgi:hypothetical protein
MKLGRIWWQNYPNRVLGVSYNIRCYFSFVKSTGCWQLVTLIPIIGIVYLLYPLPNREMMTMFMLQNHYLIVYLKPNKLINKDEKVGFYSSKAYFNLLFPPFLGCYFFILVLVYIGGQFNE